MIHVRIRVEELPVPPVPSVIQECSQCGASVWAEQRAVKGPLESWGIVACMNCVEEALKRGDREFAG